VKGSSVPFGLAQSRLSTSLGMTIFLRQRL